MEATNRAFSSFVLVPSEMRTSRKKAALPISSVDRPAMNQCLRGTKSTATAVTLGSFARTSATRPVTRRAASRARRASGSAAICSVIIGMACSLAARARHGRSARHLCNRLPGVAQVLPETGGRILFLPSSGPLQRLPMKILGISGSLRAGSSNSALLEAAARITPPPMQIVPYQGLGELPHFNPDLDGEGDAPPPAVADLRDRISASAGVIISSPEYAHGVPGSLKNALDWLVSHPDFTGKPVLLWNASAAGGDYAQASLVETLKTMSARLLVEDSLLTPFLRKKLAPGANLSDEAADALRKSLAALAAAAGSLS